MKCLGVNTATSILSVALIEGDKILHRFESPETRDQGNLLLRHIWDGLEQNHMSYEDIDRLAVCTGPGSFTGIRIGLSAMRGIAMAAKKPIVGINSFDMFAVRDGGTANLIVVESWREELYIRLDGPDGAPLIGPVNETPEDFMKRLDRPLPMIVSGDAAGKMMPFLPDADLSAQTGSAVNIARLAALAEVEDKPSPYYLREADVTVKRI